MTDIQPQPAAGSRPVTEPRPVAVTRRIAAPASVIFAILADPGRHLELDGSGMLRGAASTAKVSAVGDAFVMNMFFGPLGDYQMINHVVEFERDRRIGWEPESGEGHPDTPEEHAADSAETGGQTRWGHRWSYELTPDGPEATIVTESYDCSSAPEEERLSMRDGDVWTGAMAATLERLDHLATAQAGQADA